MSMAVTQLEGWGLEDLSAVYDLLRASLPGERIADWHVRETVFADSDASPELLLAAREGDQLVGVAAAVMRRSYPGLAESRQGGWIKLLAVAPQWRRRGIGGALVRELERRLAAAGATRVRTFRCTPHWFWPGIDLAATPALCLFLANGYQRFGEDAIDMMIPLGERDFSTSAEEQRLSVGGVRCVRVTEEYAALFRAHVGSPASGNQAALVMRALPATAHIAVAGGDMVGFAVYDACGPGWFGPMATAAHYRGRGIGSVLLKRCCADVQARGADNLEIGPVAPIGFYSKTVDAAINRCFWTLEKRL